MADVEDFLAHYGKKGMKWGVRNEDELLGRNKAKAAQADPVLVKQYAQDTKRIHAELKRQGHTELDNALLKAKYETPEGQDPKKGLSKNQKIAIGVGVGAVAVAAIGIAAYKGGLFDKNSPITEFVDKKFDRDALVKRYAENPSSGSLFETRYRAYDIAEDGLALNWSNGVHLPSGSVLKRVSSKAETAVREGGFFACYRDEDVKSYKAILPSFWTKWQVGVPMDGGFVNHYQASGAIKAPSGEETYGIFKNLIDTNAGFRGKIGLGDPGLKVSESDLKAIFKAYSGGWVTEQPEFFNAVKEKGFNALIDFNDAGSLAKTPLRVLDSSIFSIVKNEDLTFEEMTKAAAEWVPSLVHMFLVTNFLAHYGKKGMRWGERRAAKKEAKAEKLRADQEIFERRLQKLQSVMSISLTVVKIGLAIKQRQSIPRRTFVTPVRVTNTPSTEIVKMALNSKGTWTT